MLGSLESLENVLIKSGIGVGVGDIGLYAIQDDDVSQKAFLVEMFSQLNGEKWKVSNIEELELSDVLSAHCEVRNFQSARAVIKKRDDTNTKRFERARGLLTF